MRRIILSRKGFDSSSGGVASPIFSDGSLCSLPIPFSGPAPDKFQDVSVNGIRCIDALKESKAKSKPDDNCHYDPNLETGLFGQASSSQSELRNNQVGPGDLFLFFGWFKNYSENGRDLHHIFGWLQIDKVIDGNEAIQNYFKNKKKMHPHAFYKFSNNCLYLGTKNLTIGNKETPLKGFGHFKKTHKDLILTKDQATRSVWQLPKKYFSNSNPFLNRLKWLDKKECITHCKGRGQEYILDVTNHPKLIGWLHHIFRIVS
jgi:hypothetical protein